MRYEELRETLQELLVDDRALRRQVLATITKLKSRLNKYQDAAARLRTLLKMSARLQATENLSDELNLICQVIIDIRAYRRAGITLLDDDLEVLGYGWAGLSHTEVSKLKSADPLRPEERRRIFDERFRIRNSYFIPYPESEQIFEREVGVESHHDVEEFVNWHPRDLLFVPLYGPRGRLVGTLSVDDPFDGRRPTKRSLRVVELFANIAAATVASHRLYLEREAARRYLTNLVDNSADIIVATDAQGRIVVFNHAAERILGYEADEIIGQPADKLYSRVEDYRKIIRALKEEGSISGLRTVAQSKDGEEIPISLSANVLLDDEGALIGTEGVSKDLREHLAMERKLIAAEKQKTLAQTAVGVSHEINNPLESVLSACSLALENLESDDFDPELLEDKLDIALQSARRISELVQDFNKLAYGSGYRVREVAGEVTMVDFAGSRERKEPAGEYCPVPHKPRVLIADDEPNIRQLLGEYLTGEGFYVETAADGQEVVEMAAQDPPFDVVVSDIMMPKKTGYEVYAEVTEKHPETRVILMTGFGYDPTHSLLKARQDGLKAVLFKPFEPRVVRDKILEVLGASGESAAEDPPPGAKRS